MPINKYRNTILLLSATISLTVCGPGQSAFALVSGTALSKTNLNGLSLNLWPGFDQIAARYPSQTHRKSSYIDTRDGTIGYVDPQAEAEAISDRTLGYRMVIIVNKSVRGSGPGQSPSGQTLSAYVLNANGSKFEPVVLTSKDYQSRVTMADVSTGKNTHQGNTTRPGFYTPDFLDAKYVSAKFGEKMSFSIFYDGGFGTAIHATRSDWERGLGARASAGCTRLSEVNASELFEHAMNAGHGPVVEFEWQTGRILKKSYADSDPRVATAARILVINTDPANPSASVQIDPLVYQANPNFLFHLFQK